MTTIEKIRAEIERQAENYQDTYTDGMRDNLLSFLDTLEEEKSSDDLEEAAEKYHRESCNKAMLPNIDGPMLEYGGGVKDAFKAGADWQEEQQQETIELAEDHAYFAGKEKLREAILDMLDEAITHLFDGSLAGYYESLAYQAIKEKIQAL